MTLALLQNRTILCCLMSCLLLSVGSSRAELQMGAQLADPTIAVEQASYIVVRVSGVEEPAEPTIEVEKGDVDGITTNCPGLL